MSHIRVFYRFLIHRGKDHAGRNIVHADSMLRKFEREAAGEVPKTTFARAVFTSAGNGHMLVDGSDVHNLAPSTQKGNILRKSATGEEGTG